MPTPEHREKRLSSRQVKGNAASRILGVKSLWSVGNARGGKLRKLAVVANLY